MDIGVQVSVLSDTPLRLGSDVGEILTDLSPADFDNSSHLVFLRKALETRIGHFRTLQPRAYAMANPYLIRILRLVGDVGLLVLDSY